MKKHGKTLVIGIAVIIISLFVVGNAIKRTIADVKFENAVAEYESKNQYALNQFANLNGMWRLDNPSGNKFEGFLDFDPANGTCRTSKVVDDRFDIEPHLLSGSFSLSDGIYTINDSTSDSYVQLQTYRPDLCQPDYLDVKLSFKNVDDEEVHEMIYTMTPLREEYLNSDESRQLNFLLNHQIIDINNNRNNIYQEIVNHIEYIEGCNASLLDDDNAWMEIPEDSDIREIRRYKYNGAYTTDDADTQYYIIWTTGSIVRCQTVAHSSGGPTVVTTMNGGRDVVGVSGARWIESVPFNFDTAVSENEIWDNIRQSGYSGSTDDGYCVKVIKLDNRKDRINVETYTIYGLVDGQIIGEYKEDRAILSHETMSTVDDSDATVVKTGKSSSLMYELKSNGLLEIYPLDESDFDDSRDSIRVQLKYDLDDVIAARVHEGVTALEDSIFGSMKYLSSVQLPNTLISIGSMSFSRCELLKEIVIPDSVTEIGYGAFSRSGLETVTIPDAVTEIGESVFNYCKNLTDVQFPSNLQSIGKEAFAYCNAYRVVEIPESVVEIGSNAFMLTDEYIREITVHENAMRLATSAYVNENYTRQKIISIFGVLNKDSILYYDGSDFDELAERFPSINWARA